MDAVNQEKQKKHIQAEEAFELLQDKELARWYRRWRNEPWTYAVVKTIEKLAFYLVFIAVLNWEKISQLFTDPLLYLKERAPLSITGFVAFTVIFYFSWRSKAMNYYLRAKTNASLPLRDDERISTFGRIASKRLSKKYEIWGQKKWILISLLAIMLPVAFFGILYLVNGLKGNHWTPQAFLSTFGEGTGVAIFVVFFLFGALLGRGIWKEIDENFHLMQKAKSNREF